MNDVYVANARKFQVAVKPENMQFYEYAVIGSFRSLI